MVSNTVMLKRLEVPIDSKHLCCCCMLYCLAVVSTGDGYIRWL